MPIVSPQDVLTLVREAQRGCEPAQPIVVSGPGAVTLVDALAVDGDRSRISAGGDPRDAAAFVRIIGPEVSAEDRTLLRAAARAQAHVVVVERGGPHEGLAHVLPGDVVTWADGAEPPVADVVDALARGLGDDAVDLAAALPRLRDDLVRQTIVRTAVSAGVLAALRGRDRDRATLPVLALLQARMLRRIELADGVRPPAGPRGLALSVGPELASALAVGLACRAARRRIPSRSRVVDGAIAAAGTAGLAALSRRLGRLR